MVFYLLLMLLLFLNVFALACLFNIFISVSIEVIQVTLKKLGFSFSSSFHRLDIKYLCKIVVLIFIFDFLVLFFIKML